MARLEVDEVVTVGLAFIVLVNSPDTFLGKR